MNWRLGLLRTWLFLSVLWSVGLAWVVFYSHITAPRGNYPAADLPFEIPVVLLPWLLSAAFVGIGWLIRGFHSRAGREVQEEREAMNWRRGLIRLWVVAAIVWVASSGAVPRVDRHISDYWFGPTDWIPVLPCNSEGQSANGAPCNPNASQQVLTDADLLRLYSKATADGQERATLVKDALIVLLPPIVVVLAGLALTWVVGGFVTNRVN
jgi:hypothetical protein